MTNKIDTISVPTLISIRDTLKWAEQQILEYIEHGGINIKVQVSCDSTEYREREI